MCQITTVLHLAPSTVSSHLTDLRRAGWLEDHKDGRFLSCALSRDREVLRLLADALSGLEGKMTEINETLKLLKKENAEVSDSLNLPKTLE